MTEQTPSAHNDTRRRIRYAVIGLGHIAQSAVLPAFSHVRENSKLAALVSDDPAKLAELRKRYRVSRVCTYDDLDDLLASGTVDAAYIAVPNSRHAEFAIKVANAGVHVLCEKPMATTAPDCQAMIRAAEEHGVRLMIGYRLHFQPANLEAIELAQSGRLGGLRLFQSTFTMQVQPGNIRVKRELGGGPVWDLGIYCINAARYLFRAEPIEVFAFTANAGDSRFKEVEETAGAVLRFPGERLATFLTSFGAADVADFQIVGTKGTLRLENGYEYETSMRRIVKIGDHEEKKTYRRTDQFGAEIAYFSDCILNGRAPEPGGLEGMIDVRLIEALYESAALGRPVKVDVPYRMDRPGESQSIEKPAVRGEADLVHATPPSKQ